MANSDTPFGLRPRRKLYGGPTGAVNKYYRATGDSTDVFVGSIMDLGGTGDTPGTMPSVVLATAGSGGYAVGVVVAIENLTSDNLSRNYLPSGTAGYVYLADDPDQEFEVQEDSDGNALTATAIGSNIDFIIGSGNTTTGIAHTEIDSSTCDTTNTLQLRVLRLVDRPDNELGNNAKWLVKFNLHRYSHARTEGMSEG